MGKARSVSLSLNSRHFNPPPLFSSTTSAVSFFLIGMTIYHGFLGVVCCSNNYHGDTDVTNMDLVTKCQVAAIGGLEKQVKIVNEKLKGCKDQTTRASHFHVHSMIVIFIISLGLQNFHCSKEPSSELVVLMSMCIVAWVVISLNALFKMKTVYKIASVESGQMNDLRRCATILKEEVEEDFRTNGGVRDFFLYSSTLFRIRRLELHMGRHRSICSDIMLYGISTVVHSVVWCVLFALIMKAMLRC